MRIPFDLIAVLLSIDCIAESLGKNAGDTLVKPWTVIAAWCGFLFFSWLFHDIAARLTELRTRHGLIPDGGGMGIHPQLFHSRCVIAAQVLSVLLFVWVSWYLKWPAVVTHWPHWIGLNGTPAIGRLELARSTVADMFLSVSPYLAAMVLSWIPRRRLASGSRHRLIPLRVYLSFEAKMTWLPLGLCVLAAFASDIAEMLPKIWTSWLDNSTAQLALTVLGVAFGAAILVPLCAIKLWKCEPLPDGELKERLTRLMKRSGVKVRAILVWGGRGTGFLNACVIGPWSRFRYVLISPLLADELSPEETEAVLGHELGHAQYGHVTFYFSIVLCMVLGLSAAVTVGTAIGGTSLESVWHEWKLLPLAQAALTMLFIIGYIYFFFGALSRQCEREADLASAELLGTPLPLITALEKIASMNGNIRGVPCWHHGSIAERVTAVQNLSADPNASGRFHARQKKVRLALLGLTVVLIAVQLLYHTGVRA